MKHLRGLFKEHFDAFILRLVDNLLNNKTIILLNLAEYRLHTLTNSATVSSAKYQVIFRAISLDNC